jgi:ribonuclease P protein subunit POP4
LTKITPNNILRHELIGLNVRVAKSTDPTIQSVRGKVVDETRNMLTIDRRGKRILVPKNTSSFRFGLNDGTVVEVDGSRLVARPENRLKSRVRRW